MVNGDKFSPVQRLKRSFSLKLAVLFCIVVVLIAAFGGVIYMQTGAALQERTEQDMEQATTLQANTLGEWLDRTKEKTRYVSDADPVRSGDEAAIDAFLRGERTDSDGAIAAIHYYDTSDGTIIGSSEETPTGYAGADAEWMSDGFAPATADRTRVTQPYHDPVVEGPAIGIVSPVTDAAERAIVVIVDLEAKTGQLERPSAVDHSFTHVVNDRGTVVLSHHREDIASQNMGAEDEYTVESMAVERGLAGESGYHEMELDSHGHHARMAMGYAPVPGTDWVVMTHVPAEAAYALQDDITQSVLALVATAVLGLGLIGVVVGRNTTRSIGRLAEQAEKIEDGDLDVQLETSRVDEIGRLYDAFDSMRVSLREQIQEVEAARDETAALNAHLEQKANEYGTVMRECAEGDLTRRLDPESESEAMSAIAVEFNEMIAALETTTERLSQFAMEVAAASEEVTASTEEVHVASEQVATSVQEIADGAERQNANLQAINAEMENLSTTTEQIAASSNQVATLAQRMAETGRDGQETARDAIEGMDEIATESEQAVAEIERLEAEMEQIDDLVERISKVAEQTNMLALNANIEATRTGESGGGFSAVASEVKELAEETKATANEIDERIEEIKAQTTRTVDEVRDTSQQITHRREAVVETVDALNEIATYAAETNDGIQEISAATDQQAASTQEVVSMVDEAATIAEETTAETETVASAGEEQTSALNVVTQSAENLSQQAAELSGELAEFETDADIELDRSIAIDTEPDHDFSVDALPEEQAGAEPSSSTPPVDDPAADAVDAETADEAETTLEFEDTAAEETAFEFEDAESSADDSA